MSTELICGICGFLLIVIGAAIPGTKSNRKGGKTTTTEQSPEDWATTELLCFELYNTDTRKVEDTLELTLHEASTMNNHLIQENSVLRYIHKREDDETEV